MQRKKTPNLKRVAYFYLFLSDYWAILMEMSKWLGN